jgi:hypothetical protein
MRMWTQQDKYISYFGIVFVLSLTVTAILPVFPWGWILLGVGIPIHVATLVFELFGWHGGSFVFLPLCFVMILSFLLLLTLPTLGALHFRREETWVWLLVQLIVLIVDFWATFGIFFKNI